MKTAIRLIRPLSPSRHLCEVTFDGGRNYRGKQFTGRYDVELTNELNWAWMPCWEIADRSTLPLTVLIAVDELIRTAERELGMHLNYENPISTEIIAAQQAAMTA